MWIETAAFPAMGSNDYQFIRQQWRMWIETFAELFNRVGQCVNSFASNGECGLKQSRACEWSGSA